MQFARNLILLVLLFVLISQLDCAPSKYIPKITIRSVGKKLGISSSRMKKGIRRLSLYSIASMIGDVLVTQIMNAIFKRENASDNTPTILDHPIIVNRSGLPSVTPAPSKTYKTSDTPEPEVDVEYVEEYDGDDDDIYAGIY